MQTAHLSDGHGTEDVEKDEGTVRIIFTREVTMREPLDPGDWHKRKLGHNPAIEDGVEHAQEGSESEAYSKHRLHLDQR